MLLKYWLSSDIYLQVVLNTTRYIYSLVCGDSRKYS